MPDFARSHRFGSIAKSARGASNYRVTYWSEGIPVGPNVRFHSKAAAKDWLDRLEQNIAVPLSPSATFSVMCARWLSTTLPSPCLETETKDYLLGAYCVTALGTQIVAGIRPPLLRHTIDQWTSELGAELAYDTFVALEEILAFAVAMGLLKRLPFEGLHLPTRHTQIVISEDFISRIAMASQLRRTIEDSSAPPPGADEPLPASPSRLRRGERLAWAESGSEVHGVCPSMRWNRRNHGNAPLFPTRRSRSSLARIARSLPTTRSQRCRISIEQCLVR